jgi:hypothetical protein
MESRGFNRPAVAALGKSIFSAIVLMQGMLLEKGRQLLWACYYMVAVCQKPTTRSDNAGHLMAKGLEVMGMMKNLTGNNQIKRPIRKRNFLSVSVDHRNVDVG